MGKNCNFTLYASINKLWQVQQLSVLNNSNMTPVEVQHDMRSTRVLQQNDPY